MKNSSSKAWGLIKKLDCDHTKPRTRTLSVTANQVAHQLLINGRTKGKPQPKHKYKTTEKQHEIEESILRDPFSPPEL